MTVKTIIMSFIFALAILPLLSNASAKTKDYNEYKKQVALEEYPTKTLYDLWLASESDKSVTSKFLSSLSEQHMIEPIENDSEHVLVTYFAQGDLETDYILQAGGPDFYGLRLKQLGKTNLYFCTQKVPNDAMFNYGFNKFQASKEGRNNEIVKTSMEHIYDGTVVAPKAKLSHYLNSSPNVPKGSLETRMLPSKYMNESRKISVYVPANYQKNIAHNLAIFFDGEAHVASPNQAKNWETWSPTTTILDNLIAKHKIAPTIAIMVWNQGNRTGDLISDEMADFVALELVDWARDNYNINVDTSKTIVSGESRGGFAAANLAFRHSDIIGGVLSLSGSFWITAQEKENWPIYPEYDGKVIVDYKISPRLPVNFYLSVGLYDLGLGIVGANRQLRDILEVKGYKVEHTEYKGGHSYSNWRHEIPAGLISLFEPSK